MILPDAVIDDVRERAAVCVLPDDPQTAMLLVVREFGYACGEAVDAHCYDAHPRKDDLRRAAVDVAAAALVMVARLDGGEWDDGLNATGESETMKQTLYDRMSQISQDCWAAGWMQGTEYALWAAMQCVEPVAWGAGVVTQRDIEALCALSAWANGWWMRVGHEPVFISLTEWRAHYAEWKERGESEADA